MYIYYNNVVSRVAAPRRRTLPLPSGFWLPPLLLLVLLLLWDLALSHNLLERLFEFISLGRVCILAVEGAAIVEDELGVGEEIVNRGIMVAFELVLHGLQVCARSVQCSRS